MPPRHANCWLTTAEFPAGTGGGLPTHADAAVVGAGFGGLAAAFTLAERGARVAVLETESIGWGASCRNGGMVLTGLKLDAVTLVARLGLETARRMHTASLAAIDCVETFVREQAIDCDFRRSGHLEVACKSAHFDAYTRSAELIAREFRHPLRIVSPEKLSQEIGSDIYHGGLVDESSAGLHPARYVAGLARAALQAGAAIYEHAGVERIARAAEAGNAGFLLSTSRGQIFAREIFLATGAYSAVPLVPALRRKIIPLGSYIIATEPLSESLALEISPRNRMIYDSRRYLHYFRLMPDRRMLFGGRAAFFPETAARVERSARILREGMVHVFPQLRNLSVEYVWGGTLDFCRDFLPHAGAVDGAHFAAGFAGHGVAMATYLGVQIARQIAGDPVDHPFGALKFPTAPPGLTGRRPWLLPAAAAVVKLQDWLS